MRRRVPRRLLAASQRAGFDLLPRHFYSQVPELRGLRESESWRRPYGMEGIRGAEVDRQLDWVRMQCKPELVRAFEEQGGHRRACELNGALGYGPIESALLFCFTATTAPRRIVQIGAGVSTAVILDAAAHAGTELELVCIDPHPTGYLNERARAGEIELIPEPAQSVSLELLTSLGPNEMLFVDSTHAVRPGGEVNRIILEVMPKMGDGAWIHFHDVLFPYDYLPTILDEDVFFWAESPMLQAFLTGNDRFALRAAMSMLHDSASEELRQILPGYSPARHENGIATGESGHFPSAAYLEVVG